MKSSHFRNTKHRKLIRERSALAHSLNLREELRPTLWPGGSISGIRKSTSDTTVQSRTLKAQATKRAKTVKPSMPKLPWNEGDEK